MDRRFTLRGFGWGVLCVTGIMASMETLTCLKTFRWNKLLCWTLPTVGFAVSNTLCALRYQAQSLWCGACFVGHRMDDRLHHPNGRERRRRPLAEVNDILFVSDKASTCDLN